jgi:hypothetical protein
MLRNSASGACTKPGRQVKSDMGQGVPRYDQRALPPSYGWFSPCSGSGPWVQADLENGLFAGANGSDMYNKGKSDGFSCVKGHQEVTVGGLLRSYWPEIRPARQVRALWEQC